MNTQSARGSRASTWVAGSIFFVSVLGIWWLLAGGGTQAVSALSDEPNQDSSTAQTPVPTPTITPAPTPTITYEAAPDRFQQMATEVPFPVSAELTESLDILVPFGWWQANDPLNDTYQAVAEFGMECFIGVDSRGLPLGVMNYAVQWRFVADPSPEVLSAATPAQATEWLRTQLGRCNFE